MPLCILQEGAGLTAFMCAAVFSIAMWLCALLCHQAALEEQHQTALHAALSN